MKEGFPCKYCGMKNLHNFGINGFKWYVKGLLRKLRRTERNYNFAATEDIGQKNQTNSSLALIANESRGISQKMLAFLHQHIKMKKEHKNIARGTTDPGIAFIAWLISSATKQANSAEKKLQHFIG